MPKFEAYTGFAERFATAKAAEKEFLDAALLKAEMRIAEYSKKVATDSDITQASYAIVEMDVDKAQKSVEEEIVIAAEDGVKADKPEDSVDLKVWMANQEKVTSELQKSTVELQKSSAEMKS